jgi:hypothetical protein
MICHHNSFHLNAVDVVVHDVCMVETGVGTWQLGPRLDVEKISTR